MDGLKQYSTRNSALESTARQCFYKKGNTNIIQNLTNVTGTKRDSVAHIIAHKVCCNASIPSIQSSKWIVHSPRSNIYVPNILVW